jgi:hypothetical protein
MIVIDVGSATYGGDESVPYLVETYKPRVLYGFDPAEESQDFFIGDTTVCLRQWVAWTKDGRMGFRVAGLGGHVDLAAPPCQSVDLAQFIFGLGDEEIVLKMDAEGAEYVVLPHLVANDADLRLKLALVEWHCETCGLGGNGRHREGCKMDVEWWEERRRGVEGILRCPVEEWNR